MNTERPAADGDAVNELAKGCPFKGPEPFSEKDAGRFFSREREVGELLDRVRTQRLTVLTAESGAGKSSLLQAGLIPALRLVRERGGRQPLGTALCVQVRCPATGRSAAPFLANGIRNEIARLSDESVGAGCDLLLGRDCLRRDLEALLTVAVPPTPSGGFVPGSLDERDWLLGYFGQLCDKIRGELILIIDQAEEFLGSGSALYSLSAGALALQMIGNVFIKEDRLRLVLSLREESVARLRPLDRLVGSIMRRTYHLARMTSGSFRSAVMRTSEDISKEAIDRVLIWTKGLPADDASPLDTLVAQAVLKDVFITRVNRDIIDTDCLDLYQKGLQELFGSEVSSDMDIAELAMFRHIDRALRLQTSNQHPAVRDELALIGHKSGHFPEPLGHS